jgi:salicylate hydroxylase
MDTPVFSGTAVYRGLVTGPAVAEFVANPKVRVWLGAHQHCVCYPVSGGSAVSFAATVSAGEPDAEPWTAEADAAKLAAAYGEWSRPVRRLMRAAGRVRQWWLFDREVLPQWTVGRRTLLGDAAHPMLPFLAQGANQAIEDAAVLARCLVRGAANDLPAALRRYEALRIPRATAVQRGSRRGAEVLQRPGSMDGSARRDAGARDAEGEAALRAMAWLYGYDPFAARTA